MEQEQNMILKELSQTEKKISLTNLNVALKIISLDLKNKQAEAKLYSCQRFEWLSKVKFHIPECPSELLDQLSENKVFLFSNISGRNNY